jgi:hypothetical protein
MDANSETLGVGVREISHRRILIDMSVMIALATVVGFVFFSAKVGAGIVLGGGMAYFNYFWQRNSLKAILDRAAGGEQVRFLAARYILRYVAIGLAIWLVYISNVVSIFAVILGLASFAMAVMVEGFISVFSGIHRKEDY